MREREREREREGERRGKREEKEGLLKFELPFRSKQRQISNLLLSLQANDPSQPNNNANPSAGGDFESLLSQQSWDFVNNIRPPVVAAPSQSRMIPFVLSIAVVCATISLVRTVMSSPKHTSGFSHF